MSAQDRAPPGWPEPARKIDAITWRRTKRAARARLTSSSEADDSCGGFAAGVLIFTALLISLFPSRRLANARTRNKIGVEEDFGAGRETSRLRGDLACEAARHHDDDA